MEIAAFVVAVLAVAMAGASAFYAKGANDRADEANRTAKEALDLQARIDAREREFRDVSWAVGWSPWTKPKQRPQLQLSNTGLTAATNVTLVLVLPRSQQAIQVGTVEPGETRTIEIEYDKPGPAHQHIELIRDPTYRLHWTSPLGQPAEVQATARQLG